MLTYGSNAAEVFPSYSWELVKTVKVPNMRKGGTVDRHEYVSYIRMDSTETNGLESLFS